LTDSANGAALKLGNPESLCDLVAALDDLTADAKRVALLTYRDGVRDALCGMHGPRAMGLSPESLPHEYLAGRDVALAVRQQAVEPDSPENIRDYWLGFVTALRFEYFNDIDPSDWYCAGAEDGEHARERVEAGGVIGGYTESDYGHQYTSYRLIVKGPGCLGPYAEWNEAQKDRDALRAAGRTATVQGQRYIGPIGDGSPSRGWEDIEAL